MSKKIAVNRFPGVYYHESSKKLYKGKPDRCFYVNFKDVSGKLQWERVGWMSHGWTPEAAQRRRYELLEQDRVGDYKPQAQRKKGVITFGAVMNEHYLPWATENKTRGGRDDRYMYQNWLKEFDQKPLDTITALDLERLKKKMRDSGKAEATVEHALKLVRQLYNKAMVWRLYEGKNPCQGVTFPKPNNDRQRFLSAAEAEKLIDALRVKSNKVANIAIFSLYGGLRLSEVFSLKWGDVNLHNGLILLKDTKNKESRPIYLTEPLKQVIQNLTPGGPDDFLFKTKHDQPIVWLSNTFAKVVKEIGLNDGISSPKDKIVFHSLRHTYASWAVMSGIPLYVLAKAMGHKTHNMTARYSHLAQDSHRGVFEAVAAAMQQQNNVIPMK